MELVFEWDTKKAKANLKKHKVSFEEAKTIFNDPLLITFPDDGLTPFLGPLGMQVSPAKKVDANQYSSCDKLVFADAEGRATQECDPSAARPLQAGQALVSLLCLLSALPAMPKAINSGVRGSAPGQCG